jgi:ubiquinone/menaquinone biosynthesis C-methylase UbiE
MRKSYKVYSEKLVQRVNELYHDFISEQYDHLHPERFEQKEKWERIAKQFFNFSKPITIVDIGTGTGLVPLIIAKFLKKGDVFICSDISERILDVAKERISEQNFNAIFKFVKIKTQIPFKLPFKTKMADVITMNAVLHHIKNTKKFLSEVDRVLKPHGLLFIANEPNRYFYESKFLWYNYLFLQYFLNPKLAMYKVLQKLRLKKLTEKIYLYFVKSKTKEATLKHREVTTRINEVLFQEKLIENPLSPEEIAAITDVKGQEGFKPDSLLPHYELLYLETYYHIFCVTIRNYNNFIIRKYDNLLSRKYPNAGASFFVVLKKKI